MVVVASSDATVEIDSAVPAHTVIDLDRMVEIDRDVMAATDSDMVMMRDPG